MKVTVFGSTGKVGQLVMPLLLAAGHSVTVLSRGESPFASNDQVQVVRGDIHDAAAISQSLLTSDAVISTLGSWHTPSKDILSTAMQTAIPIMQTAGISRLISLTGSGAHAPGDTITTADKLSHAVFGLVAGKIIDDAEAHLQLLADSTLNWTVLRAPVMRSSDDNKYVLNNSLPKAWETIPRAAVAQAMVDQLAATTYRRQAPHLHSA